MISTSCESSAESVKLELYFQQSETYYASIEKTLNIMGYIPATCAVGGFIRILEGIVDIVQFSVRGSFALITDLFQPRPLAYGHRSGKYFLYSIHACGNICRGFVEIWPILINNIALIAYDHLLSIRFTYPIESQPGYIDPYIAMHRWIVDLVYPKQKLPLVVQPKVVEI